MLTLGELHQHYFPGEDYVVMQEVDSAIPLWDFLIFLGNQGYVFTDVYFSEGKTDPEPARTRPQPRDLDKLKATLAEPRKPGQNDFYITDYHDFISTTITGESQERNNYWEGPDRGKGGRGGVFIEPITSNQEGVPRPELPITGFRMKIVWYVNTQHRMDRFNIWAIYLGTQPTDSYAAADLNALLRKYVPLKYIINYCHRMPKLDE
jgi:hypothetical protein